MEWLASICSRGHIQDWGRHRILRSVQLSFSLLTLVAFLISIIGVRSGLSLMKLVVMQDMCSGCYLIEILSP